MILALPLPLWLFVLLLVVRMFGMVYLDVCIDGLMVHIVSKHQSKGGLQSVIFVAKTLGSMFGSLAGAVIYHKNASRQRQLPRLGDVIRDARFLFLEQTRVKPHDA